MTSLASALFEDGVAAGQNYMTLEHFTQQLARQEGLIRNLAMMLDNWLLPRHQERRRQERERTVTKYFTKEYWHNNKNFLRILLLLVLIMVTITTERILYFRHMSMLGGFTPNLLYMTSRAAGKNILALSIIVIMFVLRNSITFLRNKGWGKILPLDNNIYLHKIVGCLIFVLGMLHSACHFANFAINIQPDPVKYLQLTYSYWEAHYGGAVFRLDNSSVVSLQYSPPPHCRILALDQTAACPPAALAIPPGVHPHVLFNGGNLTCEVCEAGRAGWGYTDWMLTTRPGMFGLLGGLANPTGLGLFLTMIILFMFSLPVVRRRGHFELFFFTHYLYLVYYVLLVLHAPQFWAWSLPVGALWIGERLYRQFSMFMGKGRTIIEEGVVLPSKVTNLVIKRPPGFKFSAGDWVFVNIPRSVTNISMI